MRQPDQRLIDLYQELSDLTREICATCSPPFHCCQGESGQVGCWRAGWWAKNVYGIELEVPKLLDAAGNGRRPMISASGLNARARQSLAASYLTSTGCSVAAYMRPVCAMHVCPDRERPPRYQELMAAIALAEAERFR